MKTTATVLSILVLLSSCADKPSSGSREDVNRNCENYDISTSADLLRGAKGSYDEVMAKTMTTLAMDPKALKLIECEDAIEKNLNGSMWIICTGDGCEIK